MKVLVCGGAGFVGSHTAIELMARHHDVLILDNFSNARRRTLGRIERIAGHRPASVIADIRDAAALTDVFKSFHADVVVHFAAMKSVGESCLRPIEYFDNNISGTITLLRVMRDSGVRRLIFSSSATVYGSPDACPIGEGAPLRVSNPYGRTKLVAEELIHDLCAAESDFQTATLRYFNPVGAHPSGMLGEDPLGIPDNLMPYICQVAVGKRPKLSVFGGDYPTADGTAVRDYIHVVDLARAHVDAIDYLATENRNLTVNLGTGQGHSVLDVVRAFESASGRPIPFEICTRRQGDAACVFADPTEALRLMGWKAEFDLQHMCEDAWRWASNLASEFPG